MLGMPSIMNFVSLYTLFIISTYIYFFREINFHFGFLFFFSDITDNMKFRKVCTACFTRLNRRIAQLTDGNSTGTGNTKTEPENTSTTWLEDEIETLKNCLKNSGRNWALISQKLNETKTPEQCKKFFYNNRKKQQLDKLVTEYKRVRYLSKKQKTFKTISSRIFF